MTDRNRHATFNRDLAEIQVAADALVALLKQQFDPMFGTLQRAAVVEVNEAFARAWLAYKLVEAHR